MDAIAALEYEPDARAQSLRRGASRTLGVLLPLYENPFFWHILRGISLEAETAGYSLLLSHSSLTPEQERHSLKELAQQRVDGLVLVIGFKMLPAPILKELRKSSRPVVQITNTESEFDYVLDGYSEGTRALMGYLLGLGHRKIGFVYGVAGAPQGYDRLFTYRDVLVEAGLPADDRYVQPCGAELDDGYQAARDLLSREDRPTALLAINDLLAIAALRAASDLGLRVPQDVSIASFDDIPFARYTVPRLTTVSGQPEQDGRGAVRLLLKRLQEPERPQEMVKSVWKLNVRESTGPVPV